MSDYKYEWQQEYDFYIGKGYSALRAGQMADDYIQAQYEDKLELTRMKQKEDRLND